MNPRLQLPSSWLECKLGDVIDYGSAKKVDPSDIAAEAWILELEDIEKDTSRILKRFRFSERQSKSTKNQFAAGDVLYGKLRPYLNKIVRADHDGFCTTEIVPLRPSHWLYGGYLFHWLRHPIFMDYVSSVSHGLNMPRLGTEAGRSAPFLLAPYKEQKRIADKLDTILARVNTYREHLNRVPNILKRFRQSVVSAATSGKLTEDWREKHPDECGWRDVYLGDIAEIQGGITKDSKKQSLLLRQLNISILLCSIGNLGMFEIASNMSWSL